VSAFKRILAGLGTGILMASILIPATAVSAGAGGSCYDSTVRDRMFARRINAARKKTGKSWLRLDPQLSKAAKVHTREMVGRNTLYHTPTNTLTRRVTNWSTLGENVGVGGTVDSLHTAFMNSPAHKANVLYSSFKYVGIGTIKKGDRVWVTVIFEAASDPGSPLCR